MPSDPRLEAGDCWRDCHQRPPVPRVKERPENIAMTDARREAIRRIWIGDDPPCEQFRGDTTCKTCGLSEVTHQIGYLLATCDALQQEIMEIRAQQDQRGFSLTPTALEVAEAWQRKLAEAESQIQRLTEALRKIRAHTSYVYPSCGTLEELMKGLLTSIERIVDAALASRPSEPAK